MIRYFWTEVNIMKKIFALILFVVLLGTVVVTGFAATETQMTLVPSANDVVKGREFTVTVYVSSGKAISSFGFIPAVDDSVFEFVSGEVLVADAAISDFSKKDGGVVAFEEAKVFSGAAFRYTLKVKESAPVGKVTLSGLAAASTPTYQVDVKLNTAAVSVECNHKIDLLVQAGQGVAYGKCSICGALETWRYQADGQGVKVMEYLGKNCCPEIPGYLGGLPVTGIDAGAFSDDAQLVTVTIPATVTNIPANVFAGCNCLETILFGGSQSQWPGVNTQAAVSYNAAIKSVIAVEIADATVYRGDSFSVTVSAYGTNAFTSLGYIPLFDEDVFQLVGGAVLVSDVVMKDFTVTDGGVVLFDEETAYNGQLFRVDLKVKDNAAFGNHVLQGKLAVNRAENAVPAILSGLEMTVACRHDWNWTKVDEQTHTGNCSICDEDKTENHTYVDHICSACGDHEYWAYEVREGEMWITGYEGPGGDVVIPTTLGGMAAERLDDGVFLGCESLTAVTIPEDITYIGSEAFQNCINLKTVQVSASVTRFAGYAHFAGCSSLEGIWVDEDNTAYCNDEYGVLFNKDKKMLVAAPGTIAGSYIVPESVTKIESHAFENCVNLTAVELPDGLLEIGMFAFYNCDGLESINLPKDTQIEDIIFNPFGGCDNLAGIWAHEESPYYTSDSRGVLYNKNMTELVNAPKGITGTYVFPETIETVPYCAFAGANKLTGVVIPTNITYIDHGAFSGCTNLANVFYCGTQEQWDAMIISGGNEALLNANIRYNVGYGVPGDVNGDGEINDDDALYLLRHTLFAKDYPLASDGDVDNDGKVNDRDVIYLLRHTLFEEKYPLYPKKKEE